MTSFDDVVLPHLAAARRLARWLTKNEHDAEDVVQEASLRAFRYFRTFAGGNGRAWFLRIVRNTWGGRYASERMSAYADPFDEQQHTGSAVLSDPEALLLQTDAARVIDLAMGRLAGHHREMIELREIQGLSYREMSDIMGIPMGTVMSGLSRARQAFRAALDQCQR